MTEAEERGKRLAEQHRQRDMAEKAAQVERRATEKRAADAKARADRDKS